MPVRSHAGWVTGLLAAVVAATPALTAPEQVAQPAIQGTPTPLTGTGLIVGQVIDGMSGHPVGGALVTLSVSGSATPSGRVAAPRGAGPAGQTATPAATGRVLADGEGHFVFHDLPAGTAMLTATAPGYLGGGYGSRRPGDGAHPLALADGARIGDATVRLWQTATISGTVFDESGEAVVGAAVNALRFVLTNGVRRLTSGPTATTDDRGTYHFPLLSSGDYLVVVPTTTSSVPVATVEALQQAVTQPGGAQDVMMNLALAGSPIPMSGGIDAGNGMQYLTRGSMGPNAPPPSTSGPVLAYRTTYYPEAFGPAQAQLISLTPGEDHANVDITMRLVPTARVTGMVTGPEGPAGSLALRLVPTDTPGSAFNTQTAATATTVSAPSGAFTFLGVPAGQYDLQVTRVPRPLPNQAASPTPMLWARLPVSVENSDVAGLAVQLRPGVRVIGHVEFDGTTARPTPERLAAIPVSVIDIDGQGQAMAPARLGADGQFATIGVVPGRYLVTLGGPAGWTLKSVLANGHDLSAAPQLLEGDVTGAVVTFTDHPNQLAITVDLPVSPSSDDRPPVVVFFPANYQAWLAGGTAGRQSRLLRLPADGHTTVTAVPAGDYLFAAIPDDVSNSWQDPKTVESIARLATHVTVGDDEHKTVELRPVAIR